MIKKLGLFALVLVVAIAFAIPALAFTIDGAKGEKMYIGGTLMTDFGYWSRNKELVSGVPGPGPGTGAQTSTTNFSDRTEFILQVPPHSTLHGSFEVGGVGGFWEFGFGSDNISGSNGLDPRKLYGWYNFGNCQIMAGKTDAYLYSVVAWQVMGTYDNTHVYGFGWGSVYDRRISQVRFTQNVTKQFGWQISLVQPTQFSESLAVIPNLGTPAVPATGNVKSYAQFPLVAAKANLNFGMVTLYPAFGVQNVKWDNVRPNADDSSVAWIGLLPVVVKAGGFVGTIQGGYGRNIGDILSIEGPLQTHFRTPDGRVKDTTGVNGFVDLAYTFGPATPHIYFGFDYARNDSWNAPNSDDNNTRYMLGASINWQVMGPFYVIPEFTYYDYGKQPNNPNKMDIGKEWIGGVQFRFIF